MFAPKQRKGTPSLHLKPNLFRALAVSCAALSLSLAGCATGGQVAEKDAYALPDVSIEEVKGVTAKLNFEDATVVTPIEPYLFSTRFDVEVAYNHANAVLLSQCMQKSGFEYAPLKTVDWENLVPFDDRLFGLWDLDSAQQFGSELDRSRGVPKETTVEMGQAYNDELATCATEVNSSEKFGTLLDRMKQTTIADRILGNSNRRAEESADGREASKKFAECLDKKGLVTDPDSGFVSGDYSQISKEADIESSVGEAKCNIDTGRIQTLYNLAAQYQTAYMKDYEAQLEDVLAENTKVLDQLEAIIAGGA